MTSNTERRTNPNYDDMDIHEHDECFRKLLQRVKIVTFATCIAMSLAILPCVMFYELFCMQVAFNEEEVWL